MKKLLILLLAAALVGIVISRRRAARPEGVDKPEPETPAAEAPEPPQEPDLGPSPPPMLATEKESGVPSAEEPEGTAAAGGRPPDEVLLAASTQVPERESPPAEVGSSRQAAQASAKSMEEVGRLLEGGQRMKAREVLTDLYLQAAGARAQKLRRLLDRINEELVWNPRCVEGAVIHVVQPGETLSKIGKKYGVNWRMLCRLNRIEPDEVLRAGQKLKVLTGQTEIVAWKSEFRLALFLDGYFLKEYPIGIGKDDRTPTGQFVVDDMLVEPRWYPPGGGAIEYGEEGHLLGERWIGLADEPGAAGLGLHGTSDGGIGTKCSNGCIRLYNEDVVELYDFVQVGTPVEVRD